MRFFHFKISSSNDSTANFSFWIVDIISGSHKFSVLHFQCLESLCICAGSVPAFRLQVYTSRYRCQLHFQFIFYQQLQFSACAYCAANTYWINRIKLSSTWKLLSSTNWSVSCRREAVCFTTIVFDRNSHDFSTLVREKFLPTFYWKPNYFIENFNTDNATALNIPLARPIWNPNPCMCGYDSNATTQASAVFCRTTIQPHTPLYILYKFLSPIQFKLKLQFCSFTNQKFNTSHSIMVLNVVSRHHS